MVKESFAIIVFKQKIHIGHHNSQFQIEYRMKNLNGIFVLIILFAIRI